MATNTIGTKLVIEGEKEYTQALKNINAEQKELKSEMKLASAEFATQQNGIEALAKKYEILSKQVENQEKKVELYSQRLMQAQEAQQKAGTKVEELKEKLSDANKEFENMEQSSDVSKEALEKQQKAIQELQVKLKDAETEYSNAENSTKKWSTVLNNSQVDLINLNNQLNTVKGQLKEAEDSTDNCANSIDEYGNEIKDATENTSLFGDVLAASLTSTAIIDGIRALADGIKDIASAALETGSTFEASMSQVAATMGITVEDIANGSEAYITLTNAAEECGKSTMFSASQSADALNYLALAGYDAEKAAQTLPKVLQLAAAGGLDLAYASDLVTDSMAALGLETSSLDKYIDEMAKTSQKSNTSVAQLGEATLVCAGTASLTGQSLETMNTELGVLANNGIKGAEGGTHLRNVLLSLSAPTEKAEIALRKLNVNVSDSHGNMRDLNDIMVDLNNSLSSMGAIEKANVISTIFNKADIAAVNSLLKGTGEEFNTLKDNIINSSGAAQAMADTLNENLKGKVTVLQSALEALGISAYKIFDDNMKKSVQGATDAVGRLQNSIDNGDLGVSLSKMSDALGDFIDNAVEMGEDALPVLIDGLAWLLENADVIAGGITGIVTANVAMNNVVPVITSVVEAWNAYKIANEGATISQWAMNSAMSANPAGIIVTAIAGLAGWMAVLAIKTGEASDETAVLNKKVKEHNEKIAEGIEDRKKAAANTEAEALAAKNLTEKLIQLNEKESLSNVEKAKTKQLVSELNSIYPNLNLQIDENTGKVDMNTESLKANIEMEMQRAKVEALNERYEDSINAMAEAEADLAIVNDNLAQKEAELAGIQQERIDIIEESNKKVEEGGEASADLEQRLADLATQETNVTVEIEKLKGAQEECIETQSSLQDEIDQYNRLTQEEAEATEEAQKKLEEAEPVMINYHDALYDISEMSQETQGHITDLGVAYTEAKEKAAESLENQVGLFDQLEIKSDLTTKQMQENLKSQTDAFNTYAQDLAYASELVKKGLLDEGVLGAIQTMGMDGAGYLHELSNATTEEIQSISKSFEDMQIARDNLTSAMADIQTGYSDQMDELLGIQTDKMSIYNTNASESYEEMTEIILKAGEDQVEATTQTMEDINTAIVDNTEVLVESINTMCDETVTAATEKFQIVDERSLVWYNIGAIIPKDMAQAVKDGTSEFVNAVDNMIQKAVDKAIEKAKKAAKEIDKALGSYIK